jgi:uncharacterized phage-associated protein
MSTHRERVNNILSALGEANASLATFVRLSMHSVAESMRQNMDRHEQERPHAKRNERPEKARGRNQRCGDGWQDRDRQDRQWNGGSVCTCKDAHIRTEDGDRKKGGFRAVGVMASAIDVAAEFTRLSGERLSHLALQKYIYLAHMLFAGRNDGACLVDDEPFQAWDYGPVSPTLYARLRGFGSEPIPRVMLHGARPLNRVQAAAVKEIWDALGDASAARLVDITHEARGAWRSVYRAGARGIQIPQAEIIREYARRAA